MTAISVGVVLTRGAVRFHAGIAYDSSGAAHIRILHLAGHCRIDATSRTAGWVPVPCGLDELDLEQLSYACEAVRKANSRVPYGTTAKNSRFDSFANWKSGEDDSGLTCATFVQKVFEFAGISLADFSTWTQRAGDVEAANRLIEYLESTGEAEPAHLDLMREQAPSFVRLRPEEVGACSAATIRPLPFASAEELGKCIAVEVDRILLS